MPHITAPINPALQGLSRNYIPIHPQIVNIASNFISTAVQELILNRAFAIDLDENSTIAINEGKEGYGQSLFGLAVWDVIQFRHTPLELVATLPICLVEVNQTKNIVTTAVQGLDGTIKEYISAGDYMITLRATIASATPDMYPAQEVKAIKAILDIKDSVNIYSTILNKNMNIDRVVVTSYTFSQREDGMRNVQHLEINCLSDNPNLYKIFLAK